MIDNSQIYYDRTQFGSLEEALAFVSSLMPPEASRFRHPSTPCHEDVAERMASSEGWLR